MNDKKRIHTQCCRISKISDEVGRIDNFLALARKIIITLNRVRYSLYTLFTNSIYLSTYNLLSFNIFNSDNTNLAVYGNI